MVRCPVIVAVIIAALAVPGLSHGAPQTFNTALPVADGNFLFREQLLYRQADDDPGPMNRDLGVRGAVSVLSYGVSSDLALFTMLPYLDKELALDTPAGQRVTRGSSGIGDARAFARYTVLQHDAQGSTLRVAPFLGVKLPTGEDDERDRLGRLPQPLQSGSGSWDTFGGIIGTYQSLDYQLDTQLSYRANREANDFKAGDQLRFDASLQYRLLPRDLGDGVPAFVYGTLDVNFQHQQENEVRGLTDRNSGGQRLSLSPGLQYVTRRWMLEAVVQFPVAQNLNGTALEDDYTVRAGFRVNF